MDLSLILKESDRDNLQNICKIKHFNYYVIVLY